MTAIEQSTRRVSAEMSMVLCIVCDIRSFTEMETRVHDLIFESVDHWGEERKLELRNEHRNYVQNSQKHAQTALTEPLRAWVDANGPVTYVMKATGDGYMLAVSMADPGVDFPQRVPLAEQLVKQAFYLALESDLKIKKGFGEITRQFLEKNGDTLGFNLEAVHREGVEFKEYTRRDADPIINTRFRVAVAATLGFANFIDVSGLSPEEQDWIRTKPELERALKPQLKDVSGYGINLAFRLCNEAGRGFEREPRGRTLATPPMLLDRRLGRVISDHIRSVYGETGNPPYGVRPWPEQLRLSGFEERWAYHLVRTPPTTIPA